MDFLLLAIGIVNAIDGVKIALHVGEVVLAAFAKHEVGARLKCGIWQPTFRAHAIGASLREISQSTSVLLLKSRDFRAGAAVAMKAPMLLKS